jgi:hypothetical protein
MKIACIFESQLYSFHYDEYNEIEYERNLNQWSNTEYLYEFAKENNIQDIISFVDEISDNLEELQDLINDIAESDGQFKRLFIPLKHSETNKTISLRKGKINHNRLRLYAIKLIDELFIITGGAIKMSQRMLDHPGTAKEHSKLSAARQYLDINDIHNEDAFFELIAEP